MEQCLLWWPTLRRVWWISGPSAEPGDVPNALQPLQLLWEPATSQLDSQRGELHRPKGLSWLGESERNLGR